MKNFKAILAILVLIVVILYYYGGGFEKEVKTEMQNIENQVAMDAIKEYEIAKRGGDKMQTYVQAGLVSAAFLQANDEANYNKWKAIEKQEAKNAGLSIE